MNENFRLDFREPTKESWSYIHLLDAVRDAAQRDVSGVARYEDLPEKMHLGFDMMQLLEHCQSQLVAQGREVSFLLMFDPGTDNLPVPHVQEGVLSAPEQNLNDGNMASIENPLRIAPSPTFIGRLDNEQATVYQDAMNRTLAQENKFDYFQNSSDGHLLRQACIHPIGTAHTHPIDSPFSPHDLGMVLCNKASKMHVLLDSDGNYSLLVPSRETEWPEDEQAATELAEQWLKDAKAKFNAEVDSGEDDCSISNAVQEELIRVIAQQFKLGYYQGKQGILHRTI